MTRLTVLQQRSANRDTGALKHYKLTPQTCTDKQNERDSLVPYFVQYAIVLEGAENEKWTEENRLQPVEVKQQ